MQEKDTKQRIIAEARRLFSTHGFAGTSLVDIAHAVGIQKPSLYHFYSNKDEIYLRVMVTILEDVTEVFTDIPDSQKEVRRTFERTVQKGLEIGIQNGAAILSKEQVSAEGSKTLIREAHQKYEDMLHQVAVFLNACGVHKPEFASQFLIDSNQMYLWRCMHNEHRLSIAQYVSELADLLLPNNTK